MSKRHPHPPVNFQDFLDRKGREGLVPIVVGDKTFHLKPMELFTDDELRRFTAAEDSDDFFAVAEIILDDYAGFIDAGGTVAGLTALMGEIAEGTYEDQGADPGESEASSGS